MEQTLIKERFLLKFIVGADRIFRFHWYVDSSCGKKYWVNNQYE